jgi:hypothetical protein
MGPEMDPTHFMNIIIIETDNRGYRKIITRIPTDDMSKEEIQEYINDFNLKCNTFIQHDTWYQQIAELEG